MKKLRLITFILLAFSAILLGVSTWMRSVRTDHTLPVIRIPEQTAALSFADYSENALLEGVTAWDDKDGDLTDHILLISMVQLSGQKMNVQYAVTDSDNHVTTATRTIEYADYEPPRFSLTLPLRYPVGYTVRVKDRLTACDLLDGDLSDKIKIKSNDLDPRYEGTYPVTFEVTNSLGDTASITLDVVICPSAEVVPTILLSSNLLYLTDTSEFDPLDYVFSVTDGTVRQVTAALPEGGLTEGVNRIEYTFRHSNEIKDKAYLYVVVE